MSIEWRPENKEPSDNEITDYLSKQILTSKDMKEFGIDPERQFENK